MPLTPDEIAALDAIAKDLARHDPELAHALTAGPVLSGARPASAGAGGPPGQLERDQFPMTPRLLAFLALLLVVCLELIWPRGSAGCPRDVAPRSYIGAETTQGAVTPPGEARCGQTAAEP